VTWGEARPREGQAAASLRSKLMGDHFEVDLGGSLCGVDLTFRRRSWNFGTRMSRHPVPSGAAFDSLSHIALGRAEQHVIAPRLAS